MRWKRHYRISFPTLLAVLTSLALCVSLWHLLVCLCPPVLAPSYLLLLPGDASYLPPPYPMHELPKEDRTTLIDIRDFNYRLNNYPCNNTDYLFLLVLVHSAPTNVEHRKTIRETWGRFPDEAGVKLLFLLGAVDSPADQELLEEENREFRDVVQGSFRDTYRNLTYKHVMALKWTAYYCPNARYLLKTDDDVFVNSPMLVNFLSQKMSYWGARRLILCSPKDNEIPIRSLRYKWAVSLSEYAASVYPSYCLGFAVIYSPDVVFLLYREAQRAEYFWLEDVHITGTLAARANLSRTSLDHLVLTNAQNEALTGASRNDDGSSIGAFLLGYPDLPISSIRKLWNVVQLRRYSAHSHTPASYYV